MHLKIPNGRLITILCCFVTIVQTAYGAVALRFNENQQVLVASVNPRARVVVLGVGIMPLGHSTALWRQTKELIDVDGDGIVTWDFAPHKWPRRASWAVVDVDTGEVVVVRSPGFFAREVSLSGDRLKKDNVGQIKKIEIDRASIELMLVRPSSGSAWIATYANGGGRDDDPNERKLLMSIDHLAPIGQSVERPGHLRKGDVLVAIDTRTLDSSIIRVGKE